MTRKEFLLDLPSGLQEDRGELLAVISPAYFDRARLLGHPRAAVKQTSRGWVMVYPVNGPDGEEQVILREDRGELLAGDGDVTFPDGQTILPIPKRTSRNGL